MLQEKLLCYTHIHIMSYFKPISLTGVDFNLVLKCIEMKRKFDY